MRKVTVLAVLAALISTAAAHVIPAPKKKAPDIWGGFVTLQNTKELFVPWTKGPYKFTPSCVITPAGDLGPAKVWGFGGQYGLSVFASEPLTGGVSYVCTGKTQQPK